MTTLKTKLVSAAALATIFAAPAFADGAAQHRVFVDQVQLGQTMATLDVHVPDGAEAGLTAVSTATGNAASGLIAGGDIDFDAIQRNDCCTSAVTNLSGGTIAGDTIVATTAYANSAQGGTTNGHSYYRADQISTGNTSAETNLMLGTVERLATATTAAANVSVSGSEFGDNRAFQTQSMSGTVTAMTNASVCCSTESATLATTASGNVASSTGWTSTSYNGAVQETANTARISASSDVYMAGGTDVTGAATASGNSFVLANEWGYATLGRQGSELYQGNAASVDAVSYVELDHWAGNSTASAYGVGNSALVSNIGSDTGLNAIQGNYGNVSATADFSGQAWTGGTGGANAIAVGNSATAILCNMCGDGALQGNVKQMNAGQVTANSNTWVAYSGQIVSSASAIGNSATFTATGH